jgi:hypothetical protein
VAVCNQVLAALAAYEDPIWADGFKAIAPAAVYRCRASEEHEIYTDYNGCHRP